MIELKLKPGRKVSGPHRVTIKDLVIYFSYETPIAVYLRSSGDPMMVRQNDWGPTTGKHLNEIDGGSKEAKKARISGEHFEAYLDSLWAKIWEIHSRKLAETNQTLGIDDGRRQHHKTVQKTNDS